VDKALSEEETPLFDETPDPNDPSWGIPAAVGLWLLSVFLIMLVPALFLLPYVASRTGGQMSSDDLMQIATKDPTGIFLQILGLIPAHLITLAAAWFVVTRLRKDDFTEALGWKSGGVRWWHYVLIVVGFFAIIVVVGQYVPTVEDELTRIAMSSQAATIAIAVMAVVTAPITEEVIYRGALYSAFQRRIGPFLSILVVTLLFTSVHIPQYAENPAKIILIALLSLVLTLLRASSGNLLPAIILHTLFNSISAIQMLLEPYAGTLDKPETAAAFLHLFR
jgi:membrane protease YdiL (CAAX protease family)